MSLRKLLGIEHSLIQAPMAGSQGSALAIAVSNAGALGSLPCAMLSPSALADELAAIQSATDRPINVNFFCHQSPKEEPERTRNWGALLRPYMDEFGVDPEQVVAAPTRAPFSRESLAVLERFRPAVVSFHFGLPEPDLLAGVRAQGAKIVGNATTLEEGLWLEAHGADVIIAQGLEAGGHRGMFLSSDLTTQAGTFALVRRLVNRLHTPVIAAGGIADAQGVSAAFSLGAAGVQIGTAYLLCSESNASAVHKAALRAPGASHTALTNLFSGRPARGIVNRLMSELGPLREDLPPFPLAATPLAPLRAAAEKRNSGDFSPMWAGQNVMGCLEIPAAELTRRLMEGTAANDLF